MASVSTSHLSEATVHSRTERSSGTTDRVHRLREELLNSTPQVCVERARFVTQTYEEHEADPPILRRAKALAHVLDNMTIFVGQGELLVGNQASRPRAAPIFPEYSTDWIEKEIDQFPLRRADVYLVHPDVKRELLEEILPYWRGKTLYDRVISTLPEYVKQAQDLGVISGRGNITSGDGHIIVHYPQVMAVGLEGMIARAQQALGGLSRLSLIHI